MTRFNRQFAVPAADPAPAWRALPAELSVEAVCCLKYRRVVARDDTVRAGATILQLPARSGSRSHAGRRVELQLRLDGRLVVWDGQRTILVQPAPADPVQLRALHHARAELGATAPSVGSAAIPAATHPWRQSGQGPSSTSGSGERDCQDRGPGELTKSRNCDRSTRRMPVVESRGDYLSGTPFKPPA